MTIPQPTPMVPQPGGMAPTVAEYQNLKAQAQRLAMGQPEYVEGGAEPSGALASYGQGAPPVNVAEMNAADRTMAREADEIAVGLRQRFVNPSAPPPPGMVPPQPMQMQPPQVPGAPYPPQAQVPQPMPQHPGVQAGMIPVGQPYGAMAALPPPPPQGIAPGSLTNPGFNPAAMPQAVLQDPGGAYNPQPPPMQQPAQPSGYPAPHPMQVPAPYVDPAAIQIGRNVEVMDVYRRLGYACDLCTKLYHELRQHGVHKNAPTLMKVNEFLSLNGRQALQ